ncbi:DNA topoisomerase I [archaeon]|nr:DNA topoisomerase I [archaeon]
MIKKKKGCTSKTVVNKMSAVSKKKVPTTIVITEKPQAAAKIAAALSGGKDDKIVDKNKVAYYEFNKDNRRIVVVCAVGHLFGVMQIAKRGPFPNYEVEWRPNYEKKGASYTKKYFDVIKKLAKDADEFVVATDFDVEGEVIGWNVVRFICKQQDSKRMKFSSLTKESLDESWQNIQQHLNWGEAYAGETRHYLDWFYGINLSRGLMKALSKTGQFRILSIGRVQGPALKIVVDKEKIIEAFKSEPYWQIFLNVKDKKGKKIEVKHPQNISKKSDLLKFKHLQGQKGNAVTEIKEENVAAPIPFDLTTLQTEAYKFCNLTPVQTMKIAQNLYLEGLISYPRTSSQKYPEEIGYDKIMKKLKKYTTLTKYATNKTPTEGEKTDPAHPAIYPTGESKKLKDSDKKLYDLIVKRFISCFCDAAIVENKKVRVNVNGINFDKKGIEIKEENWMKVYPTKTKEEKIETVEGIVDVLEIRTEEKMTQPPNRYNPSSLIKELEKRNLGTKATRTNIIETLYSRGYIKEQSIEVSELGMKVAETLEKYSPKILDEALTREFEAELEKMSVDKVDYVKKEGEILDRAKKSINEIAEDMTKNLDLIGKSLADGNAAAWEAEKKDNTMTKCQVCGTGNLRIMYGKKYSRYFVSCDAYPTCKTTYTLPAGGMIKPVKDKEGNFEMCQDCGGKFPMMIRLMKGKRPWKFCFNPACPSREKYTKPKEESQENDKNKKSKQLNNSDQHNK